MGKYEKRWTSSTKDARSSNMLNDSLKTMFKMLQVDIIETSDRWWWLICSCSFHQKLQLVSTALQLHSVSVDSIFPGIIIIIIIIIISIIIISSAYLKVQGSEPGIRGSYSFVPVGASGDDIDELAKPEGAEMCLSFAGEHTHRTPLGMHGGQVVLSKAIPIYELLSTNDFSWEQSRVAQSRVSESRVAESRETQSSCE